MSSYAKWWLGVFGALMLVLAAQAEPVAQLKATDYVNDFARVLDQNTIAQMDDICRQIDEKAHAQIAVVTIRSLDGSDIESYAVDLFHQWGVGSKSTNRGVLILYAIDDHRARIEVGYGLEPILPDGKTGGFQREAIPLMRAGNYRQALLLVTSRVAKVIADDAGIQLTNLQPEAPVERDNQPGGGLSIGAIVGIGIVILIILFTPCGASCSGFCFRECLAAEAAVMAVVLVAVGADLAVAAVLADSAVVVPVAAGRAAVGSERGHKWFRRKRLATLSAGCEQRLERTWRA
jgi:uncharacterized protein